MPEESIPKMSLDRRSLKDELTAALAEETTVDRPQGIQVGEVSIRDARRGASLRATATERTDIRIAFCTSDTDVLTPGSAAQQHYADLAQFVGEIHLLVLKPGRGAVTVERPMKNVWVYHVPGRHSLQHLMRVWQTARQHLRFNTVVQPDILVATDPFTAGVATWLVSKLLHRPWQLHITENVFSLEWIVRSREHKRRHRVARFVAGRATSVQVANARIKQSAAAYCSRDTDISVLPHLYNLSAFQAPQPVNLREQYPQYSMLIMADGLFTADSPLHDVFAAIHKLLQNPRIGLLVRGTGRAKALFTQKVELLNIAPQVVWLDSSADPVPAYQSADIFIETGTDSDANERLLRAIAAGTAVVCYHNDFRDGILEDGETGFMVPAGESFMLGQQVRTLVNDSALRARFAMRAKQVAAEQLHEDVHTYFQAYRDSIASAIAPLPQTVDTSPSEAEPAPEMVAMAEPTPLVPVERPTPTVPVPPTPAASAPTSPATT
ncbi:MAG TPA: glycosyltransferase [Candidatus Paceibacterota bacterium]|nr:glycosyltransferase [Candidatus Paceibacterota bacterium]